MSPPTPNSRTEPGGLGCGSGRLWRNPFSPGRVNVCSVYREQTFCAYTHTHTHTHIHTHTYILCIYITYVCTYKFVSLLLISGCAGSLLMYVGLPLVAESGRCSLLARRRLLITVASLVAALGRPSPGSAVVAHGISCSAAGGILPDQGSDPCLLHWQVDSLPLSPREA